MVGDKIGADQNPFLTDIFQKIAVGCFPSCRGSLSTLIHTADRSNASHSGMTIGRDGSRVQSRSEFENRRHFVQAEDERTAEMWKEEMARECPLVGHRSPAGKAGPSRNLFTPQELSDKVEPRLPCRRRQAVLAGPIPLALQPIGRALS